MSQYPEKPTVLPNKIINTIFNIKQWGVDQCGNISQDEYVGQGCWCLDRLDEQYIDENGNYITTFIQIQSSITYYVDGNNFEIRISQNPNWKVYLGLEFKIQDDFELNKRSINQLHYFLNEIEELMYKKVTSNRQVIPTLNCKNITCSGKWIEYAKS